MPEQDIKQYLDLESGLARVGGNQVIFKKMLQMFSNSQEFLSFEESLAAQDYNKAADLAHAIKGMTGNLSLVKVYETSSVLMQQLRSGIPDATLLAEYRDALEKTKAYVAQYLAE